jgi:hypothetical protein
MLWLLVFLCVLVAITTRQTAGFRTAFVLQVLNLGVAAPAHNREFQERKSWI